jgi:hypothetical protein
MTSAENFVRFLTWQGENSRPIGVRFGDSVR